MSGVHSGVNKIGFRDKLDCHNGYIELNHLSVDKRRVSVIWRLILNR